MSEIAWPILMRAGLRDLRLHPTEFWALTPAELAMMLGAGEPANSLDRAGFNALSAAFPDDIDKEGAGNA